MWNVKKFMLIINSTDELTDGRVHLLLESVLQSLATEVATLVSQTVVVVGVVVQSLLCQQLHRMIHTQRVDIVGEVDTVETIECVNNLVLRHMEMGGEYKNRYIGVQIGTLLDKLGERAAKGIDVMTQREAGTVDILLELLGTVFDAKAQTAHEQHGCTFDTTYQVDRPQGARTIEWKKQIADDDGDAVYSNGNIE